MASWREFLTEGLEELGIVGAGETPTANDLDFANRRGNRLLDRMKGEGLLVPYPQTRTTWSFGAVPVATYTVGTGGTISVARPNWINDVKFYDTTITPVTEFSLGPDSLTDDEYANLSIKALTSPYPTSYYWNPTFGSTGFASLSFYPVPTSATLTGVLYHPSAIPEFASLNDTVSLPPGYHEFLVYEVALRLAPGFRREPSATLLSLHAGAKASLEASNLRQSDLRLPSFGSGSAGFNAGFYDGWGGS